MSIEEKADRYLIEGRVRAHRIEEAEADFAVRGSGQTPYSVVLRGGVWSCNCPARVWRCSHVVASQRVYAGHESRTKAEAAGVVVGGVYGSEMILSVAPAGIDDLDLGT